VGPPGRIEDESAAAQKVALGGAVGFAEYRGRMLPDIADVETGFMAIDGKRQPVMAGHDQNGDLWVAPLVNLSASTPAPARSLEWRRAERADLEHSMVRPGMTRDARMLAGLLSMAGLVYFAAGFAVGHWLA